MKEIRSISIVVTKVLLGFFVFSSASAADNPGSERDCDEFSGKLVKDRTMAAKIVEKRIANAPRVGEVAPDFKLKTLDGKVVSRSSMHSGKPLVLIAASWSCDVFRESMGGLQDLYSTYSELADFAMVYIREAHPNDGFGGVLGRGDDPQTEDHRLNVAARCREQLRIKFPVYVDSMDDAMATRWGAWPVRVFVIEPGGSVSFAGMQGPWGYRPYEGFQHGDGVRDEFDRKQSQETLEAFLAKRFFDSPVEEK